MYKSDHYLSGKELQRILNSFYSQFCRESVQPAAWLEMKRKLFSQTVWEPVYPHGWCQYKVATYVRYLNATGNCRKKENKQVLRTFIFLTRYKHISYRFHKMSLCDWFKNILIIHIFSFKFPMKKKNCCLNDNSKLMFWFLFMEINRVGEASDTTQTSEKHSWNK